jgi:hypothetical protein
VGSAAVPGPGGTLDLAAFGTPGAVAGQALGAFGAPGDGGDAPAGVSRLSWLSATTVR